MVQGMALLFFKEFLRDHNVASVVPTSTHAIKRVCAGMDFSKQNVIIEYGPGTGVFTRFLLKKMGPDSKLIAIDTNATFVEHLRRIGDPRLVVVNDSAKNVKEILARQGEPRADYVISGIPFSYFDGQLRDSIVKDTRDVLGPDGRFLVYQFVPHVRKPLKAHFQSVHTGYEFFNIPPFFVFEAASS